MIALAEIQKLSLREKLIVMDALWDSLAQEETQMEVPQWHKDLLDERDKCVEKAEAGFIDWETSKREIRSAPSGTSTS